MHDHDDHDHEPGFADPGGRSALRAASRRNPRNLPCPTCGRPDRLTPADSSRFRARVRALWTEAAKAGDSEQVRLCQLALGGDEAAAEECARVIADAEDAH